MSSRPNWDFSEYDNYSCYHISTNNSDEPERYVYVKKRKDSERMSKNADIMAFLDSFTKDLQDYVSYNKNSITTNVYNSLLIPNILFTN